MIIRKISPIPAGYYPPMTEAWMKNPEAFQNIYPNDETRHVGLFGQINSIFNSERRAKLSDILLKQYLPDVNPEVKANIEKLKSDNTYTVTTGQQIHPFLGPLYVLYKIWSTLDAAKNLNSLYPDKNFIPVFWMATEDHDFDEIKSIHAFGEKYVWEAGNQGGPVGQLSLEDLQPILGQIESKLIGQKEKLIRFQALKRCYADSPGNNLTKATRELINFLFGAEGLVVIDPDDTAFKHWFKDHFRNDILTSGYYEAYLAASDRLKRAGFEPQVNPRRTHSFYITDSKRRRIDASGSGFVVHGTQLTLQKDDIEKEIDKHPENFSPNALLRPLYQQCVLPNFTYICGPSELVYWHQTYDAFQTANLPAPFLKMRDSYLVMDEKAEEQMFELGLGEDILWQGYKYAAQEFLNKIIHGNDLRLIMADYEKVTSSMLTSFYKHKLPVLKEWKKEFESIQRRLNTEVSNFEQGIAESSSYRHLFSRLEKLIIKYFNIKTPQERVEFWLSYYINHELLYRPSVSESGR